MSQEDTSKAEKGTPADGIKEPPQTIGGILRHLGPGPVSYTHLTLPTILRV